MKKRLTKSNKSIEKMFQIIEIMSMADDSGFMRLQDISSMVKYPSPTVLRMLNSLVSCGYVYQDPDSLKYSLSMKFIIIGEAVRSQFKIREVVHPYLVELSNKCQESTCLAIDHDMTVVYIDVVENADKMLRTLQRIGKSAPMHSTGVGKLLLLNYDSEKMNELTETKGLVRLTKNTITNPSALNSELIKIKKQGYAIDDEECEEGARCVAAPIRGYNGKILACISVSGPASRMTPEKIESVKVIITGIASEISAKIGYTGDK